MSFIEVFIMALALSMDACAVSLAASAAGYAGNRRAVFRLAFHFGLFQFMMPVLGWLLGSTIEPLIKNVDHWIAFALLAFVGVRMLRAGSDASGGKQTEDPTHGLTLVMLSIATSIDALAVGLSLAMLRVSVWYPSAVISVVTCLACLIAIRLGARVGAWLDRRAQTVGGVVLILIALRIVITHIT
jgi:putative Mn2+ efflux pump MntP